MNSRQFFINHTWWGKLIGACLGYLMAGPIGIFFGILIGNFFDRGLIEHFNRPYWHYHAEKRIAVQRIFFEATFSVMGYLAKSDGHVSTREIQMATTLMNEMNLTPAEQVSAQAYFNAGKKPLFNPTHLLNALRQASHDNPALLKLFVDIQYQVSLIDGLSAKKQQALNMVLSHMGFAPLHEQAHVYEEYVRQTNHHRKREHASSYETPSYQPHRHSLDYAYAILEIPNTSSKIDVKRAYRRLMSKNHPDKLIAQGLPDKMIKLANEKTQKIRKAYEQICETKGW